MSTSIVDLEAQVTQAHEDIYSLVVTDQRTKLFLVKDQATLDIAAVTLKAHDALIEEAEKALGPQKDSAWRNYQTSLQQYKRYMDPLVSDRKMLAGAIARFLQVEDEKRQAEERRLRDEAERKARADREAEVARLRQQEEDARKAALEEHERAIEQAEREGRTLDAIALCGQPVAGPLDGLADAVAAEPLQVIVPEAVVPAIQRPSGFSMRAVPYVAEVHDLKALCRAVADGKVPSEYVKPDLPLLNALARKAKQAMNVPGVRAVQSTTNTGLAVRR